MSILTRYGGALLTSPFSRNELWRKARAVPSLDLRFAESKSLVDAISGRNLVTFTRASSATYVGADGLIKTAAVDEPRFDHNPITGESLGLLVEEQRTNLLLRSAEFDNAPWTKVGATVSANAITAPDETLTADLIVESAASSQHSADQTFTFVQGTTYTASVYAKQGPGLRFLTINRGGGAPGATFNLLTQTFVIATGGQTDVSAAIKPFANGWFLCSLTWANQTTGASQVRISISNNSASGVQTTYTGDGTSGMYVWGAQLEVGAFPTSYIPTTTATVTRSADVASITGSNFSSWYRQDEGTVFASYGLLVTTGNAANNQVVLYTDIGSTASRQFYMAAYSGSSVLRPRFFNDGSIDMFPSNSGPNNRFAVALATDNSAMSVMGAAVVVDNTGAPLSAQTRAWIGSQGGSYFINGTLRRLTYWSQRLSNNVLQEITR